MNCLSILRCIIEVGHEPDNGLLELTKEESHHLVTVRRARSTDTIEVYNGEGMVWRGHLESHQNKTAYIRIFETLQAERASTKQVELAIALPKGKAMDAVIQRCTELGVKTIQPLYTAHSEVSLKGERERDKTAKWQAVAVEAMKQCGNPWVPKIANPLTLKDYLAAFNPVATDSLVAALLPQSKPLATVLQTHPIRRDVRLFIGPEGDFSVAEYESILAAGAQPFSLGPIVLRVETAVVAAIANLNFVFSGTV